MIANSQLITSIVLLLVLLMGSLFSLLETAAVAISEHKLEALKDQKIWARYAYLLKKELEKVLIFSLFGNSLFNAMFTILATVLVSDVVANRFDMHIILPFTTLGIALFIIIFSEAMPKVIAARNPTLVLKIIVFPSYYLFFICKPVIWLIDKIVYVFTRFIKATEDAASLEELKAIIADKRSPLKGKHRSILLNSMKLDSLTIKEVLIPLRMVEAINLNGNIQAIYKQIHTSHHTRMPVYEDTMDNITGFIHVKDILSLEQDNLTLAALAQIVRPIEFISDFMSIVKQINRSSRKKTRIFVVINEYGDILGIACLEDMLEMVFGNFTTESPQQKALSVKTVDNNIIVDGTMLLRDLNDMYKLDIK
ncbi:MAG TPA: CNNM domain-containing protein, partial [Aquella sp.]|nr:CNNM domain-containing protein [Aquella sp.]